jgi:hypothetical protein
LVEENFDDQVADREAFFRDLVRLLFAVELGFVGF